jgi:signal transduction histidine kinase
MFEEMGQASAKWRLLWVLPFQALVWLLLAVRGAPLSRLVLLAGALGLAAAVFLWRLLRPARTSHQVVGGMALSGICCMLTIGATGGLRSPLVVVGLPVLYAAAIHPLKPRERHAIFGVYILGFFALALASRGPLGELYEPLAAHGDYPSAEYVVLLLASLAFIGMAFYGMGQKINAMYERVALELANRREEMCAEGEERTRALEGVAARLAHEVKNPLAAIKGLSTHMARSAEDPKVKERLGIVAAEADRLQSIVDEFLSFSRGLDELHLGPTKPFELAREMTVLLETRAEDAGVSLEVAGRAETTLNADARKLRQALLNLVLNAMQASPRGERVTIEVAKTMCAGATIKVIDRGPGMSADVLERIKKPHFTTKGGGTGLGIAVARGLIEQHGGELVTRARRGRGRP